jgi:hypothetical protein
MSAWPRFPRPWVRRRRERIGVAAYGVSTTAMRFIPLIEEGVDMGAVLEPLIASLFDFAEQPE